MSRLYCKKYRMLLSDYDASIMWCCFEPSDKSILPVWYPIGFCRYCKHIKKVHFILERDYRCLLCAIKQLFQLQSIIRYCGGIRHLGFFMFPHVIDKRHHKLTVNIWNIRKV